MTRKNPDDILNEMEGPTALEKVLIGLGGVTGGGIGEYLNRWTKPTKPTAMVKRKPFSNAMQLEFAFPEKASAMKRLGGGLKGAAIGLGAGALLDALTIGRDRVERNNERGKRYLDAMLEE